MTNTAYVSGFKCFSGTSFDLKNITVLTGSNGTGKSSLIQALLLVRLAIEKNTIAYSADGEKFFGTGWKGFPTPLNHGYELSLGTADNIFNEAQYYNSKDSTIEIKLDEEIFAIPLPKENENSTSVNLFLKKECFDQMNIPFWRKNEFYYLFTERLGPRLSLASNHTDFLHCGHKGEFTAQVLLNNDFFKVRGPRLFKDLKSDNLPQQVDAWLDSICPGTTVRVDALGTMSAQIRLRNSSVKNHVLATNIGFGISYALPVIVTGLIAEKGCVFIVENPEAHLHPKGQSNMGYFLGKVAASGVKLIIETHSEHVINGLRRSILSTSEIAADDISINFFNGFNNNDSIKIIDLKASGDLTSFPRDFFDQVNQDMAEIFRIRSVQKNG